MRFALVLLVCLVGLVGCDRFNPVGPTTSDLPVITDFSASAGSVKTGTLVTLSWQANHCVAANITPLIGSVALSGSRSVPLTASTTFTLTCAGADGLRQAQGALTVLVTP